MYRDEWTVTDIIMCAVLLLVGIPIAIQQNAFWIALIMSFLGGGLTERNFRNWYEFRRDRYLKEETEGEGSIER